MAGMPQPTQRLRELIATDPNEWSALMAQAQNGDAVAYRRLLVGITPYVRAIASRAHRNPSDAEETVQDVLLTLHSIRHTYDQTRPFKPWLAGIATHRVVDRMRLLGRAFAREVALELEHETFAAEDTNDGPVLLDQRALHVALEALPPGQRQAVTLLKLREMSLREAATISGTSVGSLKVATHRGVKALRRLLGQQDVDS